jgi:hypothetical protein
MHDLPTKFPAGLLDLTSDSIWLKQKRWVVEDTNKLSKIVEEIDHILDDR